MQNAQTVKVPILTYHSIDGSGSVISTAPEVFRRQMKSLSDEGYDAISLKTFADKIANGHMPEKTAVLTFDDGFQNFYTEAFPVLAQCQFDATVFLVTDRCGGCNDWDGVSSPIPRSKLLSWEEIKFLSKHGIEFGSHTRTHPDLTKISPEKVSTEITESKTIIEDHLGREVYTFAYPYGSYNRTIKQIAGETYMAACSTNLGKAGLKSDLFSLERVDAYYLLNQKVFDSLSLKSFDRYLSIRHGMRKLKSLVN